MRQARVSPDVIFIAPKLLLHVKKKNCTYNLINSFKRETTVINNYVSIYFVLGEISKWCKSKTWQHTHSFFGKIQT